MNLNHQEQDELSRLEAIFDEGGGRGVWIAERIDELRAKRDQAAHPAACPHCGGTVVNQAQPDMLLRHVRLNDDGSITIGDPSDSCDFTGPDILFCHGCGSEFVQPAGVTEHYDSGLKVEYPKPISKDDPNHIGAKVTYMGFDQEDRRTLRYALAVLEAAHVTNVEPGRLQRLRLAFADEEQGHG